MKEILLTLVDDLEDLRASLAVVARAGTRPMTIGNARDAKSLAIKEYRQAYDKLRKQIEALQ